jgi:hypothetical protein
VIVEESQMRELSSSHQDSTQLNEEKQSEEIKSNDESEVIEKESFEKHSKREDFDTSRHLLDLFSNLHQQQQQQQEQQEQQHQEQQQVQQQKQITAVIIKFCYYNSQIYI